MTYAVRTGLAVAEMPLPVGNCAGVPKRRPATPSFRVLFHDRQHLPLVDVAKQWQDPHHSTAIPLRWVQLWQVVHYFLELSTESLHCPVTGLTRGLNTEL